MQFPRIITDFKISEICQTRGNENYFKIHNSTAYKFLQALSRRQYFYRDKTGKEGTLRFRVSYENIKPQLIVQRKIGDMIREEVVDDTFPVMDINIGGVVVEDFVKRFFKAYSEQVFGRRNKLIHFRKRVKALKQSLYSAKKSNELNTQWIKLKYAFEIALADLTSTIHVYDFLRNELIEKDRLFSGFFRSLRRRPFFYPAKVATFKEPQFWDSESWNNRNRERYNSLRHADEDRSVLFIQKWDERMVAGIELVTELKEVASHLLFRYKSIPQHERSEKEACVASFQMLVLSTKRAYALLDSLDSLPEFTRSLQEVGEITQLIRADQNLRTFFREGYRLTFFQNAVLAFITAASSLLLGVGWLFAGISSVLGVIILAALLADLVLYACSVDKMACSKNEMETTDADRLNGALKAFECHVNEVQVQTKETDQKVDECRKKYLESLTCLRKRGVSSQTCVN